MSLNIKNEEAHRLAQELAALTGESLTAAVTRALRTELERLHHERNAETRLQRLMEIAHDCASRLKEPFKSIDHAELLYDDELGLPK